MVSQVCILKAGSQSSFQSMQGPRKSNSKRPRWQESRIISEVSCCPGLNSWNDSS